MPIDDSHAAISARKRQFATTHWSIVVAAGQGGTAESRRALADLCAAYWYPLYAFVRRSGHAPPDAEELTQAFFARLLDKNDVAGADRQRGKFRTFLLVAMKHFLANQRDRARALKRGGGRAAIALDFESAEARYRIEPVDELTAEKLFDRQWALALLDRVLAGLRQRYADDGKERLFDGLKGCLAGRDAGPGYRDLAESLEMTEGAVKMAVHRLRRRYRERLRKEIEQTVASAEELEDEIRELFKTFSA